MKRLKFLFTFLLALCLLPTVASAAQDIYFKPFHVGDEITVTLDADGKVTGKFIVIQETPEGNIPNAEDDFKKGDNAFEYVTAIYVGTLGESIYSSKTGVDVPVKSTTATSTMILKAIDAGWVNVEDIRLLTLADLASLGITAADSSKIAEHAWLKTGAPYWLGEDVTTTTTSAHAIVEADGNVTIGTLGLAEKANLRPVIRIHKGFVKDAMICNCPDCEEEERFCPNDPTISIQSCIDSGKDVSFCVMTLCTKDKVCPNDSSINIQSCIDGGKSEEECIKNLCPGGKKPENPKTGSYISMIGFGSLILIIGALLVATRKKTYFSK